MNQINLCDNRFLIYIPNFHTAKQISSLFVHCHTNKMSAVTISGMPIRLWCLVRGSSSAFYVTIGRDNFIIDLKKLIKAEIPNDVKAIQLTLWKLKNPVDDEHISDIQNLTLQV